MSEKHYVLWEPGWEQYEAVRTVVERARAECGECPFSDHDLGGRVIAAERCEICRLKLVAELLPLVEDET